MASQIRVFLPGNRQTVNEINNGWLWEDKHSDFSSHVVAHRFGLQQGSKIRVIDNCSCCGLNGSVGLKEKFRLHTVDQLAAMISYSFSLCESPRPKLLGRTYDLKAAYKQFPVCVCVCVCVSQIVICYELESMNLGWKNHTSWA